jgi:hypothetical protein
MVGLQSTKIIIHIGAVAKLFEDVWEFGRAKLPLRS